METNYVLQPPNISIQLYRHQLVSIYRMEQLELNQKIIKKKKNIIIQQDCSIGVNSDKTGYGKTLSMIGLIARDKMPWDMNKKYIYKYNINYYNGLYKETIYQVYKRINSTLILASPSIVEQWNKEFSNTDISVYIIKNKKGYETWYTNKDKYQVVIVVPNFYNMLINQTSNYAWKRFIFDEAGHLKVTKMAEIRCGFLWLVTATPESVYPLHNKTKENMMKEIIQNKHVHPNKLLSIINPYILHNQDFIDKIQIKNDDLFVQECYVMPQTNYRTHICYNKILSVIGNTINDNIRNLLAADNISEAIHVLGGKETDNIYELVKNKKTQEIDKYTKYLDLHTHLNDEVEILKYQKLLEQSNKELSILDERIKDVLNDTCSICMSELNKPVMETNCQNVFCGKCILTWLENSKKCPLCRHDIIKKELIYCNHKKEKYQPRNTSMPTKKDTVINLILSKPDGKFIIFSDYDNTFDNLSLHISNNNDIKFSELKGSSIARDNIINRYKYGDLQVLLLNAKHNCAGINLQETTDIIFYHTIENNTETQIIGRANRIGRTIPLDVHYLHIID